MNFAGNYKLLLSDVVQYGVRELNQRTGQGITALPAGVSFSLDLRDNILPTCGMRLTKPHIAAAEAAWCLLGHPHVDWLRRHTNVWDAFADVEDCALCNGSGAFGMWPDKCNNCQGSGKTYWLEQAYGNRWRNTFGVDQLEEGLKRLKADQSDRRVWISSWDPGEDIQNKEQKTVPCPVGFTLSILDGKLNSTLMIRSSDLYMGLPYDVMRHAFIMAACAASIGVELGYARFTLAHPHVYDSQLLLVKEMLCSGVVVPSLPMPNIPIHVIMANPDAYVNDIRADAARYNWPLYNPKSEVVR